MENFGLFFVFSLAEKLEYDVVNGGPQRKHLCRPPYVVFIFSAQLAAIRRVSMAKIVCQNSDTISQIQKAVFDLPDTFINSHVSCDDVESLDLTPWQEVSACAISGQRIEVGATRRVSPCVQCSCTLNGPDCRSLHITSCKELAQDFTEEQILNDDVCKVQCTKDISDSAADEAAP